MNITFRPYNFFSLSRKMSMETIVVELGSDLGILIPDAAAKLLGLQEGDQVTLESGNDAIVIKKLHPAQAGCRGDRSPR